MCRVTEMHLLFYLQFFLFARLKCCTWTLVVLFLSFSQMFIGMSERSFSRHLIGYLQSEWRDFPERKIWPKQHFDLRTLSHNISSNTPIIQSWIWETLTLPAIPSQIHPEPQGGVGVYALPFYIDHNHCEKPKIFFLIFWNFIMN